MIVIASLLESSKKSTVTLVIIFRVIDDADLYVLPIISILERKPKISSIEEDGLMYCTFIKDEGGDFKIKMLQINAYLTELRQKNIIKRCLVR